MRPTPVAAARVFRCKSNKAFEAMIMILVDKNFQLPKEILDAFELEVDEREKQGELVASLIEKWLDEQARAALKAQVIEGCKYMSETALEVERDFNPMDEELHRAIEY
jgi:hypothetical protein